VNRSLTELLTQRLDLAEVAFAEAMTCALAAVLLDWSKRQVKRGCKDMTTLGFYEARTHLSELLDQVAKGKKVLITRRGKPAAVIGPPPREGQRDVRQVVKEMLAFRDGEGPMLGGQLSIRELIEEGRRW
jgi:prevent-host-death family protein